VQRMRIVVVHPQEVGPAPLTAEPVNRPIGGLIGFPLGEAGQPGLRAHLIVVAAEALRETKALVGTKAETKAPVA